VQVPSPDPVVDLSDVSLFTVSSVFREITIYHRLSIIEYGEPPILGALVMVVIHDGAPQKSESRGRQNDKEGRGK
jgi:hypothetical protein